MTKMLYGLKEIKEPFIQPVLTIGNFDGIHLGHKALFDKVKERAAAIGGQSLLMTFDPHPLRVLRPPNAPPLINTQRQKINLLKVQGLDFILVLPFTYKLSRLSAEDFVEQILVKHIGIAELVVGHDYTFGRGRQGNLSLLEKLGKQYGFILHVVHAVSLNGGPVSSTRIRDLVQGGQMPEVARLLSRPFALTGKVIEGSGRGAKLLGFPTANLSVDQELLPREGIYAVKVKLGKKILGGVTNIGRNPTFAGRGLNVETYIFDLNQDLYGKTITLFFLERLRDEKRFPDARTLKEQIARDVLSAQKIIFKPGNFPLTKKNPPDKLRLFL
jgi:riboflavin kinase/FMN adenylyltransferase